MPSNPFAALAPPDQGEPPEAREETPKEEEEEDEEESGKTGGVQQQEHGGEDDRQHECDDPSAGQPVGSSSLAEDLLAAPSTLPASDPVRVETAACLRKCMLEGTTPPKWVMKLVLPAPTRPAGGPTERQIGEVKGVPNTLQQKLDVAFQGVERSTIQASTSSSPIQHSGSSDSSRSHSPTDQPSHPSAVAHTPATVASARDSLDPACITSAVTSSVEDHASPSAPDTDTFSIKYLTSQPHSSW